eukprot:GFUD01069757.1.p1 GENE.GFUD01069757.1~~GFUD01069757.1.p1  ORF type:complete len:375 (+),score=96.95 GFUD01069757.1:31-1155(+)
MRSFKLITALLFAFTCKETTANKGKIDKIAAILKDTVKTDLTTLLNQHDLSLEQTIDGFMKTIDYVDKNIAELKTHLETRIEEYNENTMTNLQEFEKNTGEMMSTMNETIMTNLNNINTLSMEERNKIISWAHQRAHLHEDILKSRISACAYDYGHLGKGVVRYNSANGGYIKESGSFRVYNNTNIKEEDVLDRDTGIFKVPINASGEYIFTFSVTIDSFDQKLMPSSYWFAKAGKKIEGTEIFANVGSSKIHDKVPGSRQVFLKLEENDEISVIQELKTDIQDFHVSFCGALLHLEKASESPGGSFADAKDAEFPAGTLAEQDTTWKYEFAAGFKDSEPKDKPEKAKDNKPEVTDIFVKIDDGDWKTANAAWP